MALVIFRDQSTLCSSMGVPPMGACNYARPRVPHRHQRERSVLPCAARQRPTRFEVCRVGFAHRWSKPTLQPPSPTATQRDTGFQPVPTSRSFTGKPRPLNSHTTSTGWKPVSQWSFSMASRSFGHWALGIGHWSLIRIWLLGHWDFPPSPVCLSAAPRPSWIPKNRGSI